MMANRVNASGYVVSRESVAVGVQMSTIASRIGLDRVCAWAGIALFGVGCWWKADPGAVPVIEAAKLPVLHQGDAEAGQVRAIAWIRSGSAHDPVGQEGLACAVVHAHLHLQTSARQTRRFSFPRQIPTSYYLTHPARLGGNQLTRRGRKCYASNRFPRVFGFL